MKILVIGNINSEISKAIDIAKKRKAKVILATSISESLEIIIKGNSFDIVLIDVSFDIKDLSKTLLDHKINTNLVAYGLNATPKEAVNAIKSGAKEFLPLPPDEELIAAILETIAVDQNDLIYRSESMGDILKIIDKVAPSNAHILITGESGTGKEVLARLIHNKSTRKNENYVRVNCAAIPENLIESELFGHEKGSFTGASEKRVGKFEESSNGTLLLDEISEMDVRLQAKLLRAIQEKEIDRIGSKSPISVDLRIIATSNRDISSEISKGNFREDLYFRINVINIEIPPLRERKEDIIPLAEFFVEKYCKNNNLPIKNISNSAKLSLEDHDWPGNIRELENSIHRAVLLSDDEIASNNLILKKKNNIIRDTEDKKLILNTVNYCLGDLNQAANILGISIKNLSSKLKNAVDKS